MTPQEEAGARILREAYDRWRDQPPVTVAISRINLYNMIMGLQLASRHPGVPPTPLEGWLDVGKQLTEVLCDSPEIYALTQAGWNPAFDVDQEEPVDIPVRRFIDGRWQTVETTLSDYRANEGADGRQVYRVKPDAPEPKEVRPGVADYSELPLDAINVVPRTEEQPSGADATAPHPYIQEELTSPLCHTCDLLPGASVHNPLHQIVNMGKPYCYRIDQPAEHRPEGTFMMAWGSLATAPGPFRDVEHAATYEAARVRVGHAYRGPLTVRVWQRRKDEHYGQEPPADAYRLDLGDRSDDLKTATDLIDALTAAGWSDEQ